MTDIAKGLEADLLEAAKAYRQMVRRVGTGAPQVNAVHSPQQQSTPEGGNMPAKKKAEKTTRRTNTTNKATAPKTGRARKTATKRKAKAGTT